MLVLKTFLILVCSSGFWCRGCDRTRVYFQSRNFYSLLHWDEVELPGGDVRYSVTYHEYGEPSQPHPECQNISAASCDLSSVMTNIHMRYFAKVLVGGVCLGQYVGFVPIEQTVLGAPDVSTSAGQLSLTVTLVPPLGPQNRSITEINSWVSGPRGSTPSIIYIVQFTQPQSQSRREYQNTSGVITVNHAEGGATYCGVAVYQLAHPSTKRLSENATFCLTLPAASVLGLRLVVGVATAVVLIVLSGVALVVCQLYVTQKRNAPKALMMSRTSAPRLCPDPTVQISKLQVCRESVVKRTPPEPPVSPITQGSYAAQDCHTRPWQSHSYTNQQMAPIEPGQRTPDSCTSYSAVVGVMVPSDPEELDSGLGCSLSQEAESQTMDFSEAMPEPKLPVSRGANGRLHFSSLVFRPLLLGVAQDEPITPPVTASTPALETLPLLVDLLLKDDSGCTERDLGPQYSRMYLPNRVPHSQLDPVTTGSNYRQNWVPGIGPEPLVKGADRVLEPEENKEGWAQGFRGSFLDNWEVQIYS